MANKLTMEQFEMLCENMIVDDIGNTNKKCPLCGNDVVVIRARSSSTIKCTTAGCFSSTGRGI